MYNQFPVFKAPIKVVAHRGDSKNFPENSMLAFKSAVELGVDIIETDLHISSDGVVFVWHDGDSFKLDGSKTDLSKRSWSELKELDLGFTYIDKDGKRPFSSKNIRLMEFGDVLKEFPNTRFNIDLKDKSYFLVREVYRILRENSAYNRVIVASFHSDNLKMIRSLSPLVATSHGKSEVVLRVILEKLKIYRFLSKIIPTYPVIQIPILYGSIEVVTKRFIKILHKRGVKVHVWTINDRYTMNMLLKMGVDGIMTDDPRMLLELLKK